MKASTMKTNALIRKTARWKDSQRVVRLKVRKLFRKIERIAQAQEGKQ